MDPNCVNVIVPGQPVLLTVVIPLIAAAIAGLGGALVGGYMAGRSAQRAVSLAHRMDLRRQQQSEEIALERFYRTIYTELNLAWKGYMSNVGNALDNLEEGKAMEVLFPFWPGGEEFPVYKANLHQISRIPDAELQILILRTFGRFEGIIDSVILNNTLLQESWKLLALGEKLPHPRQRRAMQIGVASLAQLAQGMKKDHLALRSDVTTLLAKAKNLIDERG